MDVRRIGAAVACVATFASAPQVRAQGSGWYPRLQLDNDAYNFWMSPGLRSDDQYSNGVSLAMETARAPWWGVRFAAGTPACADATTRSGRCVSTIVAIAQDIYTPDLSRPPFSRLDWESERPYAAWLRMSGTARIVAPTSLREIEVAAGVTGAPALGRLAQSIAHTITRPYTLTATGWETQVGFEPGLLAGYRQRWLVARSEIGHRLAADLSPSAGATAGNILTEADAGATVRVGVNLSHPWDPREWRGRQPWEFYLTAAGRRDLVVHDFSLDGTLFGDGRHVERVPSVGQYELGATVRYQRLSLVYRAVTRSREYATGPAHHTFSSMIASLGALP